MFHMIAPYKLRVRELRDAAERIMEGDEPEHIFPFFWGHHQVLPPSDVTDGRGRSIAFHIPGRRSWRPTTSEGRTSFHFSHASIVRVRAGTIVDGRFIHPGSAQAHCAYVEREGAVVALALEPFAAPLGHAAADPRHPIAFHHQENAHDLARYRGHYLFDDEQHVDVDGVYIADLRAAAQATTGNRLRPMSGLGVAASGGEVDWLLPDFPGGELDGDLAGADRGLRGEDDRASPLADRGREGKERGRGARAVTHLGYIERDTATAIQPDGARAIITNIAIDADDRLKFWEAVEHSESAPGPDLMTVDPAKAPEFWARVIDRPDCPGELRDALVSTDVSARQCFVVRSGKETRAFLATVTGWEGKRKKRAGESREDYRAHGAGLATFHDGRGGRTQYRIVGELPNQLSMAGRMRVLRRLAREFDQRQLPYNLAMHAPDYGSDERQWHFHLDYYDRPARLLSERDVALARAKGFEPVGDGVGEWDIAARFYKDGRTDRTARPFRREKVREVVDNDWIPHLRGRLAFAVNQELRAEGLYPRYDPRRYDAMGIKAEPGEHLGTQLTAAEGKGFVSDAGVANEKKQWKAILDDLDARRQRGVAEIGQAIALRNARIAKVELSSAEHAAIEAGLLAVEKEGLQALDAAYDGELAGHLTARACSRATKLVSVNQAMLDGDASKERPLSDARRKARERLRDAGQHYLRRLDPMREATVKAVALCDQAGADAVRARETAAREVDALIGAVEDRTAGIARAIAHVEPTERAGAPSLADDVVAAAPNAADAPVIGDRFEGEQQITGGGLGRDRARGVDGAVRPAPADRERAAAALAREIDELTAVVRRDRRLLRRDRNGWRFEHPDALIRSRFLALRDDPRLAGAIEHAVNPPAAALPPPPLDQERKPASPQVLAPVEPPRTTAAPAKRDEAVAVVSSFPHQPPAPAPSPDPPRRRSTVDELIHERVPLFLDQQGRIDAARLARRGVMVADADLDHPRLRGRARAQAERAYAAVEAFVTKHPGFIIEKEGRLSLNPAAMPTIRGFADDHDDERMQAILRAAVARSTMNEEPPPALPMSVAVPPVVEKAPRTSVLVRDDEMIAVARAALDEKRRQQAMTEETRAAMARRGAGRVAVSPGVSSPAGNAERGQQAEPPARSPSRWPPPGGDFSR